MTQARSPVAGTVAAMPRGILDDIRVRMRALDLDLTGLRVVTEAATGAYACTAVIAALAGGQVTCTARDTRHGRFEDAAAATLGLARQAGVADRIDIRRAIGPEVWRQCDILTNSGHLRPITSEVIALLPPRAVIALMFEAWEFRPADLDLAACRARGIRIAGVNERHPDVGVFPLLGPLAVRQLHDAGVKVAGARIALVCDNPFAPHIAAGMRAAGAEVTPAARVQDLDGGGHDAAVVALDPQLNPPLGASDLVRLAVAAPGGLVAQFWGDIAPEARQASPVRIWPPEPPGTGHMGILLNALGHDPIVRLQAGGLRAAEIVRRGLPEPEGGVADRL